MCQTAAVTSRVKQMRPCHLSSTAVRDRAVDSSAGRPEDESVSESDTRPHVVIVGGGFGGLYAARALAGAPVRVTLLDRRNHHLFQPLLYQVATAALNPADIATPLRSILRRAANVTVLLAEVRSVDLAARRLALPDGELAYDGLVLAAGAGHSYFGHDDWEPLAPSLKTLEDALEIRRRVLVAYEEAERQPDGPEKQTNIYCCTPMSDKETRFFRLSGRNYRDALSDEELNKKHQTIFEQDRVIVEAQRPEELPLDLAEELHLRGPDTAGLEYRRALRELGVRWG